MGSIVPTIGTAAREAAQAFAQQPFSSLAGAARGGVSLYNLAEGVQNRAQQERTDDVTLQQLRARSALVRRGSQNPRCMPRCGLPRKSNRNSIVANDDNYALAA
jgi:hypothetical protein